MADIVKAPAGNQLVPSGGLLYIYCGRNYSSPYILTRRVSLS